jgi:hypothetical protein
LGGDRGDEGEGGERVEVTRQGLRGNGWGREGEGRCGSHPGRLRKLDLEIRLPLLTIVRHAAGRHKRDRDRSSAPRWGWRRCGR